MTKKTEYKVLVDNKSCHGGNFDWINYLPKQMKDGSWKPGKWTPRIKDVEMCEEGYHLTNDPKGWLIARIKIFVAEGKFRGETIDDKTVYGSVRLLSPVTFNTGKENTGEFNSGDGNSGDGNSGHRNSGHWNNGDGNSGDGNSGHWNSGDGNIGDGNSGHWNSGDGNSGDRNSGHRNSGNRNSGDGNSGHWNSGDGNSGNRNSGDGNSGHWNRGSYHSGAFNVGTPPSFFVFNKPLSWEEYRDISWPNYFYFNLTEWHSYSEEEMEKDRAKKARSGELRVVNYKDAWKKSFEKASEAEIRQTIRLPNFDYAVFEEITGISKEMIEGRLGG